VKIHKSLALTAEIRRDTFISLISQAQINKDQKDQQWWLSFKKKSIGLVEIRKY